VTVPSLEGASAVVTGGASGLGAAAARRLHEAGAAVVIADLPGGRGPALAAELGGRARFVAADVRDERALAGAVETAAAMAPLRVAVACAGVAPAGRVLGRDGPLPLGDFAAVVEVNLVGTFNLLRLAAAAMAGTEPRADGERGVIVMTASAAASEGQVGQAAYAASKAGVAGLTLTAARDLASRRIRVVTISPGAMDTPMVAAFPPEVVASLVAQVPSPPRLGRPEEFAALVAHVVENGYLNGAVLRLDGGLRMGPR
jgi:NAD(P)-dependent dehydrogenase (short-subunit alcohol dehydrogenase family)